MRKQTYKPTEKVKMTFECTIDERAYIKMLAAKKHMTLGELLLSYVEADMPKKKPNKKTLEAHKEALEDGGEPYESMDDFWEGMGVKKGA